MVLYVAIWFPPLTERAALTATGGLASILSCHIWVTFDGVDHDDEFCPGNGPVEITLFQEVFVSDVLVSTFKPTFGIKSAVGGAFV